MPAEDRQALARPDGPAAGRAWFVAAALVVALAAFCATFTQVYNYDIFWHLASGQWMLKHLAVLGSDPFSVDPEPRWVNVHWLFQVIVASLHAVGGFAALSAMKAVLAAATLVVLALALRRDVPVAWLVLCGLATILVVETRMRARPEAFTILFLAVTVALVEGVRRGGSARRLWWLVPLMVVWVNLHGLYVLGPVLFWSAMLGAAVDRRLGRQTFGSLPTQRALVPLLAATAACLVSPWPAEAAVQPLLLWTRISGETAAFRYGVSEFLPTWESPYHLLAAAAIVLPAAGVCAASFRRAPAGHFLWLAAFGAAAMLARRNVALTGPVCGYLLALHGGAIFRAAARRLARQTPGLDRRAKPARKAGKPPPPAGSPAGHPARLRSLRPALNVAALLLAAAMSLACATEWTFRVRGIHRRFGPGLYRPHYAIDIARRLGRLQGPGDIFCEDWGDAGTFIYHSRPRRTWMDGRLEAHSLERYLSQGRTAQALRSAASAATAHLPPSLRFFYVKALSRDHLVAMSQSGRFRLLFVDPTGACFARTDWRAPSSAQPGAPLPAGTNLREYDRPLRPDGQVQTVPVERRRWFRQNPTSPNYRLGAMFLWLGWQSPQGTLRPPQALLDRCTLLAMRYLTAAQADGLTDPSVVTGMLAVAHQQRALQEGVVCSAAVPLDYHSARALCLYRRLDFRNLGDETLRGFAAQHVDALVRARQLDAAERAAAALLGNLPPNLPTGKRAELEALHARLAAAARYCRRRAETLTMPLPQRARALAAPDVGLADQAIAELRAGPPHVENRMLLGDLLLNRGLAEQAREVYARIEPPGQQRRAIRLRLLLCDWVEDGPLAGDDARARAASTSAPQEHAAEAYYRALRLEEIGRYDAALDALRDVRPADAHLAELVDRLRSRLALPCP